MFDEILDELGVAPLGCEVKERVGALERLVQGLALHPDTVLAHGRLERLHLVLGKEPL